MTKEEALKQFAQLGAVWFGNSKQHFAFSAYDRLQGWNKLADKWKEEAEEEWAEAEEVLNRLVELGCKPADLQEAMKTQEENMSAGVPWVALTANAGENARDEYIAAGFTDYLSKPVDGNLMEAMLKDYLPKEKVILASPVAGSMPSLYQTPTFLVSKTMSLVR